ncbi:uncharacterized protein LOC126795426 [Argentina anserina]|uniref:uncharacterized protein LOC126795426 n=1 Tax=Argentina anserina TaxID=57926 RepID=UPI0021767958|nr:uncharacterized protein LOC126795426 [Potentilla anserina]
MKGQGYDGASNMRGIYRVLQTLFLEECLYAYFVHCYAHPFQLTLNATAQGVPEIWQFFITLSLIVNFVDASAKRHSALRATRKEKIAELVACGELQTGNGANQICTLQRAEFQTEDICNLAKNFYPADFDDGEMCTLVLECAYYENDMRSDLKFKKLESIAELSHALVQTRKSQFFPMIYRLICLVLTIHVSTATTEMTFSAMNTIKNRLKNKMEDDFIDDCMVLHIEKEYGDSVDNEMVIHDFENLSNRRVRFT